MLYIVERNTDLPLLELGDQTRHIGPALFKRCVDDKLVFDVSVTDDNFMAVLMGFCDDAAIQNLAAYFLETREGITTRILVHHNLPVWDVLEAPQDRQKLYRESINPYRARIIGGKMRSVLTSIPTTRDAEIDYIPYTEYTDIYFKMCDQPWDAIKAAQYKLIDVLNAAKTLRFTNNDGTDLSMDIEGFTFCNSVIARNIPGSEVFSAPRVDSTNGVIVAKGRFAAKDHAGAVMEDLTLHFKDGVLVTAIAAKGQEHLDRAINTDAGARRIGEIGIGTNPYLKRHVASILLSEKIGGSFHVALGDAYTMTDYMGDPVHLDNGNRSHLHWDITTMLIGKEGRIIADGTPIMIDGLFTDPALDVLNRGWAAVS
jgi:aminopeptidase